MASKSNKSGPPAYTDLKQFPGLFSLNTKAAKKTKLTKGKPTPKPKPSKTNPGL